MSAPHRAARVGLEKARANLQSALEFARATGLKMLDEGTPEAEVARLLGVDRMTVRKWAGKR